MLVMQLPYVENAFREFMNGVAFVMKEDTNNLLEIRGFLHLNSVLRKKYGSMPFYIDQDKPITGFDLATRLEIAHQEIEVIFVNGFVQALDFVIQPGDRVAFLPPGCPGPYRIALGFYGKNQGNEANLKNSRKD